MVATARRGPLTDEQRDLVERYHGLACHVADRWIARWGRYRSELRDVAIDALVHCAASFDAGRNVKFATYLATIVSYRCHDRVRVLHGRNRRLRPCPLSDAGDVTDRHDYIRQVDDRDECRFYQNRLKPAQNTVLHMISYDGCSQKEAAARLGLSAQTVNSRIRGARLACS